MYRVVIYNGNEETIIHSPTENPEAPHLYSCKLVQGSSGEIDSLTFCILPNNPGYEKLYSYTTMISVIDTNATPEKAEFSGRVLSIGPQMEESGLVYKQVVCEDRLGYLCDSIQPYKEKTTYTVREFFQLLLDNHNAQVDDYKRIYLGEVTFDTSSGNVTKGLNYQTTWEAITDKLLSLGGEIQLYSLNGLLYIDYVNELGTMGEQTIEIAKNMRSFEQDESPTEIITRLIPLGDYKEEQSEGSEDYERINIESVNGGKNYLDDEAAQERYGILCGTVIWDDVTEPENLMEKGKQWLEDQGIEETITLSAYDLSIIGLEPDALERYNYYETINPLLGIDRYYRVAKRTVDVCNPTDITFTMGSQSKSISSTLTGASGQAKDAADASAALNANLTKTVATLIAGNAIILQLEATVAYIEDAYIDRATIDELLAAYATIEYLEAEYATITELQAAFADVELLNADVANILNLLAGNAGVGDLQTIILTADNAIIDEAIIINALMGTVLADIIDSNVIYTDYIKIANNDSRSLWIDGSTMQFTDENGVVRVQIGLDASRNYNYYLWDADGNLIWDPMGLTEAGLTGNGAIIKDAAVADDANISAYKLNIEELTSVLNANGQLVLSAEQITIGGGTLDYALTEITEQIENLEAMEGVESVENYYILGGPDAPPWEPGDDGAASILGEMILGEAILGTTHWTTEQPKASEGEYVWFSQKITYVNGDIVWTTPTLLTDEYIRNAITVQQTELEVIQGQIQAKIWLSDIETTADELTTIINDQYGILTVLIDAIDLRVGTLTTAVDYYFTELSSQVAAISLDLSSITAEVREVDEKYSNALVEGTPYYAVSTNPNWYPPYDVEGRTSVLGEMILGEAILGVSGNEWTTEQPAWKEGQYIWMTSLRERADGTTYWTEPTLLTDEWMRENATQMSERYSQIVMQVDSISEEVVNVQSELALNYSTTTEIKAIIDAAVTDSASTILQEVSYNYASINYVDEALQDIDLNSVKKIETYYCVCALDDEPSHDKQQLYFEESFTAGTRQSGWVLYNVPYGNNSISWEDDEMGNCLKLIRGESYIPQVQRIIPDAGSYNISFEAATKSGQEQQTVCRFGAAAQSWDSEIGQLKSNEWTTFTYDFSMSAGSALYFGNASDASALASLLIRNCVIVRPYLWTKEQPNVEEDEKLWVSYLITYLDGHTEWTDPICIITDLSDYVTQTEFINNTATIEQYVDESSASIRSEAQSTYATIGEVSRNISSIEQYVDESSASIRSEVQNVYSDLSGTIISTAASLELYVDQSMAAINLTVSGSLGNTASITLTTNGGDIVRSLDLSKVREAFANDKSAITISAGTVAFISNTLLITSSQFTLDSSGNATFSGNLSAPSGNIGGFTIGSSSLYNGLSSLTGDGSGVYVGTNGVSVSNGDGRWTYLTNGSFRQQSGSGLLWMNSGNLCIGNTGYTFTNGGGFSMDRDDFYAYYSTSSSTYTEWFAIVNAKQSVSIYGSLYLNGSSITGSDESLKSNIATLSVQSDQDYEKVVETLEPVTFEYKKEESKKKHIGFTYQNAVEALEAGGVDPDESAMVQMFEDHDTGESYGGIEYNDIVALLVYEVKKLKSEINEMKGA